jgi:hypothetical protein
VCERVGGPGQGLRGGLRKLEFSGTAKLPPSDLPFCPPCFMGASSYSRVISIPVEFGVESYSELLSSLINGSIYIVFIGSTKEMYTESNVFAVLGVVQCTFFGSGCIGEDHSFGKTLFVTIHERLHITPLHCLLCEGISLYSYQRRNSEHYFARCLYTSTWLSILPFPGLA